MTGRFTSLTQRRHDFYRDSQRGLFRRRLGLTVTKTADYSEASRESQTFKEVIHMHWNLIWGKRDWMESIFHRFADGKIWCLQELYHYVEYLSNGQTYKIF